jgi:four helix bundle protein
MAYGLWSEGGYRQGMAFRFEGLEIFQLALDFAGEVYRVSRRFPKEEMFGLTANLRRAATSVSLNIAEGSGRGTKRDFAHFIDVASGSLFETVSGFLLAERLELVAPADVALLRVQAELLSKKLSSFKRSLLDPKP